MTFGYIRGLSGSKYRSLYPFLGQVLRHVLIADEEVVTWVRASFENAELNGVHRVAPITILSLLRLILVLVQHSSIYEFPTGVDSVSRS